MDSNHCTRFLHLDYTQTMGAGVANTVYAIFVLPLATSSFLNYFIHFLRDRTT